MKTHSVSQAVYSHIADQPDPNDDRRAIKEEELFSVREKQPDDKDAPRKKEVETMASPPPLSKVLAMTPLHSPISEVSTPCLDEMIQQRKRKFDIPAALFKHFTPFNVAKNFRGGWVSPPRGPPWATS